MLRRCRSRRDCKTAAGDLPQKQVQHLRHARAGHGRHSNLIQRSAIEVTLRRGDDQGHTGEQRPDFFEEAALVLERIAARLAGVEEEQHSVREMSEGRDRLAFHLVPLVHRPVEQPRGIEDLVPMDAAVEVAERHAFRRERVIRDLRTTGGGRPKVADYPRSEEHTSELQSPYDLVCRLLLEKKKNKYNDIDMRNTDRTYSK